MKDATTTASKVAPDGGYGWVIAFAMGLNSFIYIPMMHCFGLIYKETFTELGLSATQGSLIINLHAAFGMLTGLFHGVLLKILGYRKGALIAAVCYFSGITLTSFSKNFIHFLIFYGLVASLGTGISKASYSLALNTYFRKRRSKAMGFTMTVTALGSIILPQLINLLIKFYHPEDVMLILGGISAHSFIAALLLQPVERHMKEEENEIDPEDKEKKLEENAISKSKFSLKDDKSVPFFRLIPTLPDPLKHFTRDMEICDSHLTLHEPTPKKHKNLLAHMSNMFDLDLLKDPVFVNILVGMALAIFSELNFSVLTPFILNDYGLSTDEIATFMSTFAFADIIFRLLGPYIGDYLKKSPRVIFLFTLVVLITMRFILLLSSNFSMVMLTAVGMGVAKGVRRVYVGLIVPAHVSLDKLPSASGMEMMANGFCILAGGSLLGVVRDLTGSYTLCIVIMNFVSFLTIVIWTAEWLIVQSKKEKAVSKKIKNIEENVLLSKL